MNEQQVCACCEDLFDLDTMQEFLSDLLCAECVSGVLGTAEEVAKIVNVPIRTIYPCDCQPETYLIWNRKEGDESKYWCEKCGKVPQWFQEVLKKAEEYAEMFEEAGT